MRDLNILEHSIVSRPKAIRLAVDLGAQNSAIISNLACTQDEISRAASDEYKIKYRPTNLSSAINHNALICRKASILFAGNISSQHIVGTEFPSPSEVMGTFGQPLTTKTGIGYLYSLGATDLMVSATLLMVRRKYFRKVSKRADLVRDIKLGKLISTLRKMESNLLHEDVEFVASNLEKTGYSGVWISRTSDSVKEIYKDVLDSTEPVRSMLYPT